jgi:hypothetical protein
MEKPSWRQSLHERIKATDYRDVLTFIGASIIYIGAITMMVILPLKLLPTQDNSSDSIDPNVANNNNYLPSSCALYTVLADAVGLPLSEGPLKLPFQRPVESCRTFTSAAMEVLINNVTARMVDKDLARLFENTYPNTLGIVSPVYLAD